MFEKIRKNKKFMIIGCVVTIACIVGIIFMVKKNSGPTLELQSPEEKISAQNRDEIIIPAVLSELPDNSYPAASVAVTFDKDKLEFIGYTIGTMKCYDDYDKDSGEEMKLKIPEWAFNAEVANKEGEARAMYLDATASKNSYCIEGFKKGTQDMPFKLKFKLKDSVNPGDKLEIKIKEAAFATLTGAEDKSTISTKDGYGELKTKDAIIKIK